MVPFQWMVQLCVINIIRVFQSCKLVLRVVHVIDVFNNIGSLYNIVLEFAYDRNELLFLLLSILIVQNLVKRQYCLKICY